MIRSLVSAALVLATLVGTVAADSPIAIFEIPTDLTPQTRLDELVFARWRQAGIEPVALCSDAVFVRRVYLDVIGTLPTAEEAREFLLDQEPDKRRRLIDRLLEREEFAEIGRAHV